MRELYKRFDYNEVITPQIFDRELFLTSGHLPAYAENMFLAASKENVENVCEHLAAMHEKDGGKLDAKEVEKALLDGIRFGVKPMNCPAHALMFGSTRRSYRELPMRMADFGRLHRFERSGVTQGMTRVLTFCQDDGHIFCALEQVQAEIESFVDLVYAVYQDFGFTEVRVVIATRPDVRIGADEIWDRSEKALIDGVEAKKLRSEIAPGEGAFYGPKIEFHLKDAIGRSWQLGTPGSAANNAFCLTDATGNDLPNLSGLCGRTSDRRSLTRDWRVKTFALSAIDTVDLTDKWTLFGGLRADHYKLSMDTFSNSGANAGAQTGDYGFSDTLVNGHLGVSYKINPMGMVYASYGTAQDINGGEPDTGTSAGYGGLVIFNGSAAGAKPETSQNIELGTKWNLLDDKLVATAAMFQTTKGDVMEGADYNTQGTFNTGKNRVRGIEFGLAGNLTRDFQLQAGVAFMNS